MPWFVMKLHLCPTVFFSHMCLKTIKSGNKWDLSWGSDSKHPPLNAERFIFLGRNVKRLSQITLLSWWKSQSRIIFLSQLPLTSSYVPQVYDAVYSYYLAFDKMAREGTITKVGFQLEKNIQVSLVLGIRNLVFFIPTVWLACHFEKACFWRIEKIQLQKEWICWCPRCV